MALSATVSNVSLAAAPSAEEKKTVTTKNTEPIKIGFITSLTGTASRAGDDELKGWNLYLDQNHHQLGGRKVEVFMEDDESQKDVAAVRFKKLVEQNKVQIMDGFILSNIAYHIAPLVDSLQVPTLFAVPNGDDLTQRRHPKWSVRLSSTSSQSAAPFAVWVRKNLKFNKVATLGFDYGFGWEAIGGFQRAFEEEGGQVVQKLWAPLASKDYSEQVKKLRSDVDAVYFAVTTNAAATVYNQYRETGSKLPVIGAGQGLDDRTLDAAGTAVKGAMSALHYSSALNNPANTHFVQAYRAKYNGSEPSHFSESGYVSAMWIDKALQSLKGSADDKNKLLAAIQSVQLTDAPRGPMKLDSYGNPVENIYILKVDKVNGHYMNTVVATLTNVSQFGKMKPEEYMKQPPFKFNYPPCTHCAQ